MPATVTTERRRLHAPMSGQVAARSSAANAASSTPACQRLATSCGASAGSFRLRTVAKDMIAFVPFLLFLVFQLPAEQPRSHGLFDRLPNLRRRHVGRLATRPARRRVRVRAGHAVHARSVPPPRDRRPAFVILSDPR